MSVFPQKIVGIDFHDYSANLVELKLKGEAVSLEAYNRVSIPSGVIRDGEINKEDELKLILLDLLQKSNPKPVESKNVAIIFPSNKVLTHVFTLPSNLDENEIRKALPYEAETVIPFSIKDVYWDFMVLEKESRVENHTGQRVLFACITKKVADQYANVFESMGLTPFLFGVHAETLKYAMIGQLNDGEASLIIDIGVLSVDYLIIENKAIKYFYSSNKSGKKLINELSKNLQVPGNLIFDKKEKNKLGDVTNFPKIKKFIEQIYGEVQKIIEGQWKKANVEVENIVLTGEFLNLPSFYNLAKVYFPNQKIIIGDPKIGLSVDDKRFLPLEKGGEVPVPHSIYFTNTIGISLRGLIGRLSGGINLLPDRLKESFVNRRNVLFVAIAAISMAVIALLISTFLFFTYQTLVYKRANLEIQQLSIEKMIHGTRYQEIRNEINKFNTEINVLSNMDKGLFSVPVVLEDIKDLLPNGVEFTSIEFKDPDLSLEITGIASTRDKLLETQQNFENAEFISEVFAPISNYDEKTQISFLIKIKLDFTKLDKHGSSTNT